MELNLHEWQVGYLAGIIDGEGCITITRDAKHYVPIVSVCGTSQLLMNTLGEITGLGSMFASPRRDKHHKTQMNWRLQSRVEILILLRKVCPFLLLKKKQAVLLMEFCEGRINKTLPASREEEIYDELHRLNARGVV